MLVAKYPTKKALKESIRHPLRYEETSMFAPEYRRDGTLTVVGPTAHRRVWFARVELSAGRIVSVK